MPARRALCSTLSLRPWCSCVCVSTTLAPVWCVRAWGSQRVYSKDACHISSSLRAARSLVRRIATDSNWWRDQNRTHQKDIFELRSTNAAALLITVVRHMQLVDARLMAQQHSAAAVQSTALVKEWNHQPAISQRGVLVHRQPGQSWCIPLVLSSASVGPPVHHTNTDQAQRKRVAAIRCCNMVYMWSILVAHYTCAHQAPGSHPDQLQPLGLIHRFHRLPEKRLETCELLGLRAPKCIAPCVLKG